LPGDVCPVVFARCCLPGGVCPVVFVMPTEQAVWMCLLASGNVDRPVIGRHRQVNGREAVMDAAAYAVLFSNDLMFESRVVGAARLAGLELRQVSQLDDCVELVNQPECALLLFDLETTSTDPESAIAGLRTPRPPLVAYGPHVRSELLQSATAAGWDQVLPRSQFVTELNTILQTAQQAWSQRQQ